MIKKLAMFHCYPTLNQASENAVNQMISIEQNSEKTNQSYAVLLSPVGASYDAFENFYKRGEAFQQTVTEHLMKNNYPYESK